MTHSCPPRRPSDRDGRDGIGTHRARAQPGPEFGGKRVLRRHSGLEGQGPQTESVLGMLKRGSDRDGADRDELGRATSELQSLMRISYAVFCLKKKNTITDMTQVESRSAA